MSEPLQNFFKNQAGWILTMIAVIISTAMQWQKLQSGLDQLADHERRLRQHEITDTATAVSLGKDEVMRTEIIRRLDGIELAINEIRLKR